MRTEGVERGVNVVGALIHEGVTSLLWKTNDNQGGKWAA